jgi:hypothetical protein
MAGVKPEPLSPFQPIVDKDGKPTDYFIRYMQAMATKVDNPPVESVCGKTGVVVLHDADILP